jgi:hypothetical protein
MVPPGATRARLAPRQWHLPLTAPSGRAPSGRAPCSKACLAPRRWHLPLDPPSLLFRPLCPSQQVSIPALVFCVWSSPLPHPAFVCLPPSLSSRPCGASADRRRVGCSSSFNNCVIFCPCGATTALGLCRLQSKIVVILYRINTIRLCRMLVRDTGRAPKSLCSNTSISPRVSPACPSVFKIAAEIMFPR